ncbi:DUF421 domain-containing protein [Bacillus sp. Marseille-P3661]|uniref:DUF421 domain-containing protein n=1 Tax=Bacillus sp. Marseille-P3661 TaxID=1936234 RepID=UPI000C81CBCA|nr:DUF421 domain-containing protein [Bacillus sp. Marseille-P3661]
MEYIQTLVELFVGFIALFVLTKVLGKTQITQITAFDFISALVLGELVGNAIYDDDVKIGIVLFGVTIWGLLIYVLEIITQKMKRTRKFLEGEPAIVIRKGQIQREILKKNHLDINQLQHLLRLKDVFSIQDVEYAILETDGQVSVLKKSTVSTPTRKDLNLTPQNVVLPITLIIDGEMVRDNLQSIGFDAVWLRNQIQASGATSIKDVLYAEYQEGQALHVQMYK